MWRLRLWLAVAAAAALTCCADDSWNDGDVEEQTIDFPHTVVLKAEQSLVAPTGVVLDGAKYYTADIAATKNQTIKLQSGWGDGPADCLPLHVCRPSPSSKPEVFDSFDKVCSLPADETDPCIIQNAEIGYGFTVRLKTANGYGRFWVKEVKGMGDSAEVTLVYSLFGMMD